MLNVPLRTYRFSLVLIATFLTLPSPVISESQPPKSVATSQIESPENNKKENIVSNSETSSKAGESCSFPTSDEELRKLLTPEQYRITKENGTERPFHNEYWDNKEPGIYVDVISGEPLFSSTDKFDSGTGWPSFHQPISSGEVVTKEDSSHGMVRTEVRSKDSDAHLGHVFPDGPKGSRYCINSGSLRFVPVRDLEKEGLGEYLELFD